MRQGTRRIDLEVELMKGDIARIHEAIEKIIARYDKAIQALHNRIQDLEDK